MDVRAGPWRGLHVSGSVCVFTSVVCICVSVCVSVCLCVPGLAECEPQTLRSSLSDM